MNKTSSSIFQDFSRRFNDVDPRSKDWLMVSSVWHFIIFNAVYYLLVKVILPKYMENRPPYRLKNYLVAYNIFQVFASAGLLYAFVKNDTFKSNLFQCQNIDYSYEEKAYGLALTLYYNMIIKMVEYSETVVFVLRKKFNQASHLHFYHHTGTMFFTWCSVRYMPGSVGAVISAMNLVIHCFMYTYYTVSVFIPMQKVARGFKQLMTTMQMIQLVMLASVAAIAVVDEKCNASKIVAFLFVTNICYQLYLFGKFYVEHYLRKTKHSSID